MTPRPQLPKVGPVEDEDEDITHLFRAASQSSGFSFPALPSFSDPETAGQSEPNLPEFEDDDILTDISLPAFERTNANPSGAVARGPASFDDLIPTTPSIRVRLRPADAVEPSPAILLNHLAAVGIFEASIAELPRWETEPRQRSRGIVPLSVALLLVLAGAVAGYRHHRELQNQRLRDAELVNQSVEALIRSGRVADLRTSNQQLSRVFELDPTNSRAARLWLENRVIGGLVLPELALGLSSAASRGRLCGVPEPELAAARVASYLTDSDLAGAEELLTRSDGAAKREPLYQLVAGATLERAGDPHAIARYELARSLDPQSVYIKLHLARALLLNRDTQRARPILAELRIQLPSDDANLRALSALASIVEPGPSPDTSSLARWTTEDKASVILALRAVASWSEAANASARGDQNAAASALESALAQAQGPLLAMRLGFWGLELGRPALARSAALRATSFAPEYVGARELLTRVALVSGQLQEAEGAAETLRTESPEAALVRAVQDYEYGRAAALATALQAHGSTLDEPPWRGLGLAPSVLLGTRALDEQKLRLLASPSVPWGAVIAADAALDSGRLEVVEEILNSGTLSPASAAQQLRLARLRRYQGRLHQALALSLRAVEQMPTLAALIERSTELLDTGDLSNTRKLLTQYRTVLGPAARWIEALIDVAEDHAPRANARLAEIEPPGDESPLCVRLLASKALVASTDKRARSYLFRVAVRAAKHPDLLLAARLLNH